MRHTDDFCEDCTAGKLTHAPHMRPAAHAEHPLNQVFTDVHGPVPTKSRCGNCYWVSFVDDHSRFPAVYFISKQYKVFGALKHYRLWAETVTGQKISNLHDDKGGEYTSTELDKYLTDTGIHREHLICDTPQQLGVTEQLNHTLDEGITTLLAQSGLSCIWWEDTTHHFLYGRMRLPTLVTTPTTLHNLFYGKRGSIKHLRPFSCLAYVHLQKDQCSILIGYPVNYKGWQFWDPAARKEIISDSAVFCKSVFPLRQPSLSAIDKCVNPNLAIILESPVSTTVILHPPPDDNGLPP